MNINKKDDLEKSRIIASSDNKHDFQNYFDANVFYDTLFKCNIYGNPSPLGEDTILKNLFNIQRHRTQAYLTPNPNVSPKDENLQISFTSNYIDEDKNIKEKIVSYTIYTAEDKKKTKKNIDLQGMENMLEYMNIENNLPTAVIDFDYGLALNLFASWIKGSGLEKGYIYSGPEVLFDPAPKIQEKTLKKKSNGKLVLNDIEVTSSYIPSKNDCLNFNENDVNVRFNTNRNIFMFSKKDKKNNGYSLIESNKKGKYILADKTFAEKTSSCSGFFKKIMKNIITYIKNNRNSGEFSIYNLLNEVKAKIEPKNILQGEVYSSEHFIAKRLGDAGQAIASRNIPSSFLITHDRILVAFALSIQTPYIVLCHPKVGKNPKKLTILVNNDYLNEEMKIENLRKNIRIIQNRIINYFDKNISENISENISNSNISETINEIKNQLLIKYNLIKDYIENNINLINTKHTEMYSTLYNLINSFVSFEKSMVKNINEMYKYYITITRIFNIQLSYYIDVLNNLNDKEFIESNKYDDNIELINEEQKLKNILMKYLKLENIYNFVKKYDDIKNMSSISFINDGNKENKIEFDINKLDKELLLFRTTDRPKRRIKKMINKVVLSGNTLFNTTTGFYVIEDFYENLLQVNSNTNSIKLLNETFEKLSTMIELLIKKEDNINCGKMLTENIEFLIEKNKELQNGGQRPSPSIIPLKSDSFSSRRRDIIGAKTMEQKRQERMRKIQEMQRQKRRRQIKQRREEIEEIDYYKIFKEQEKIVNIVNLIYKMIFLDELELKALMSIDKYRIIIENMIEEIRNSDLIFDDINKEYFHEEIENNTFDDILYKEELDINVFKTGLNIGEFKTLTPLRSKPLPIQNNYGNIEIQTGGYGNNDSREKIIKSKKRGETIKKKNNKNNNKKIKRRNKTIKKKK